MSNFFGGAIGGALLGAIVGLLVSVIFEEYLVNTRKRLRLRLSIRIGRLRRYAIDNQRELFRLGPLVTSMFVLEGDGEQVIDEQSILVRVEPESVQLPEEMEQWRQEFLAEQQARKERAENYFWNGPSYAIADFSVARTIIDEEPEVSLRLLHSDYATFWATQQLDRKFADGTTPRSRYLTPFEVYPLRVPSFMSSSFGTNIALLTSDGKFIFARRSHLVGSRPGVWSTSANEALSRSLDSQGRSAPNLYDVVRRGVEEELGIAPFEYELKMLAFHLDVDLHQWGGTWVGVLKNVTGQQVLDRRARGVADKYENRELKMVDSEAKTTLRFLIEQGMNGTMAPHTPLVFYFSLVHVLGRRNVNRALAQIESSHRWRSTRAFRYLAVLRALNSRCLSYISTLFTNVATIIAHLFRR